MRAYAEVPVARPGSSVLLRALTAGALVAGLLAFWLGPRIGYAHLDRVRSDAAVRA